MAKGEFENRDREELGFGDLPLPLARERGEAGQLKSPFSDVPADMRRSNEARAEAAATGLGTPNLDYTVRGIYDSRPVNGFDFSVSATLELDIRDEGGPINDLRYAQIFAVPFGRVAVMRRIIFMNLSSDEEGYNSITTNAVADFQVQLCRNGGVVSPVNMTPQVAPLGSVTYRKATFVLCPYTLQTFQIYDELDTFGLQFITPPTPDQVTPTFYAHVTFEGNLLVKTGVPPQFEVANLAGRTAARAVGAADAPALMHDQGMGRAFTTDNVPAKPATRAIQTPAVRTESARAAHFRAVEAGTKKDTFRRTRR